LARSGLVAVKLVPRFTAAGVQSAARAFGSRSVIRRRAPYTLGHSATRLWLAVGNNVSVSAEAG